MLGNFFAGFEKRAQEKKALVLAEMELDKQKENSPEEAPSVLGRTISKAGPVLSDLTLESDRGKFETFKG